VFGRVGSTHGTGWAPSLTGYRRKRVNQRMTPVWLSLRAGLRRGWRPWLALALLLGVMGGVVLTAAAGARRTDTAYPRLLSWANASDVQILPTNVASPGYFRALRSLPQVSAMSSVILLNFAIKIHGHYLPYNHVSVYASPDGRLGTSIDRVKILTGRFPNPADPRSAVIDQQMAADQHVAPGGTIRLFVVPNDRHGNPLLSRAFPVAFHVAEIGVFDNEIVPGVTGGYPTALLSPAFLRTAVARRVTNSGVGAYVRLRPGVAVAAFLRQASALTHRYPATGGIADVSPAGEIAGTERAIRPYAVALALFAALAGIITLVVVGQLLGRQVIMEAAEFPILRALGMTRPRLAALSLARAGAVTVLGACLAVGAAIAASPLTPIGPARLAEPAPGIAVNVAILITGLALIILLPLAVVAPAAWRAASAAGGADGLAEPAGLPRVSRLASALSVAGSVTGGVGVRTAFEPGRGRTAVPVRSALTGVVVAVAAVTAAAVFGSSLARLVSTPHRYGQNWQQTLDLEFGAFPARLLDRIVSAQRGVAGYAYGNYGQLNVDGQPVAAVGLAPVRGQGYLTVVAGHLPSGPGQIAVGARTLRSLHRRVGQTVQVTGYGYGLVGGRARPMRVVGEAVFPSLGTRGSFTGTDLGTGAVVTPPVLSVPSPQTGCPGPAICYNFVLLRYPPGASLNAHAARLRAAVAAMGCPPGSCQVTGDQRPGDIQDYTGIRDVPLLLGALLALLGVATLGHVLVTGVRRRRRDLAILKVVGMRQGQLVRVVSWQAAALTAVALAVGVPLGIVAGRWSWSLFAGSVGVATDPSIPLLLLLAVAAVALLLATLSATIPGRAAARVRPAAVLRNE
jgi:FtsX-like permease family/MacB-like periplasmic core domain